jgi:hypothetical protein
MCLLYFCMTGFDTKSKNVKVDLVYTITYFKVKTVYNGTARDWTFSDEGRFCLLEPLQLQTLGTVKCSAKYRITVYPGSLKTLFTHSIQKYTKLLRDYTSTN